LWKISSKEKEEYQRAKWTQLRKNEMQKSHAGNQKNLKGKNMQNTGRETRKMRNLPQCKKHVFGAFMPQSGSSSIIKRCYCCPKIMGV